MYDGETLTHRNLDLKYLERFEIWCWRRLEKVNWADRVKNEEILQKVNEERYILHTIKKWEVNLIDHILRRNCLLKYIIKGKLEGRIEVTRWRGLRRKQLLDDLKETRGPWKLKEKH